MPSQIAIPLRFDTSDPARLKADLERFAQSLDLYTRQGSELFVPRYLAIPQVNPTSLAFGYVARVNLIDGDTLNMQMPPAERKNFGKRCAILRETMPGIVRIQAGSALIGGASIYQMANDIHFVEFLLDDGNWYPTRPGSGIAL